jgi:3-phenylpropionate/trans-cinnamate dioxygenase ferredoxin subunit
MSLTIRVKRNGPYVIALEDAPNVVILDGDGNILVPEAGRSIALCRCGGSATKPFCDKTHRRIGFCDPEAQQPVAPDPGSAAQ